MQKIIKPYKIRGVINAPPSKSFMQRAMAATVLAALSENGIETENAECVAKSYPAFF